MPLMLSEVAEGRMTLEHYVRISAANPARAFGMWPDMGGWAQAQQIYCCRYGARRSHNVRPFTQPGQDHALRGKEDDRRTAAYNCTRKACATIVNLSEVKDMVAR